MKVEHVSEQEGVHKHQAKRGGKHCERPLFCSEIVMVDVKISALQLL